ncbi:hypothetical protein C8Q75DRAFT_727022, partial [Abortiporus biennis]
FCPSCPQPGINITDDDDKEYDGIPDLQSTKEDKNGNGNFKFDHLKMSNGSSTVSLSNGDAFLVTSNDYRQHLKLASKDKNLGEKSSCTQFKAINASNSSKKSIDVTGIGAIECGRHACFVPHSVVDFQKGERQANIDYAFKCAMDHFQHTNTFLLLYDIMCQWFVHFSDHCKRYPTLGPIADKIIRCGIGLFHVYGHQDACFFRYALSFILSAGCLDGE